MSASWKTVTFIPAPNDVPGHLILPLLLGAGALEVSTTVKPSESGSDTSNTSDASRWPPRLYSGEIQLSISVLWPDNHAQNPDEVLRRAIPGPLSGPFPFC